MDFHEEPFFCHMAPCLNPAQIDMGIKMGFKKRNHDAPSNTTLNWKDPTGIVDR